MARGNLGYKTSANNLKFRRAAATLEITWKDITLNRNEYSKPIIKEVGPQFQLSFAGDIFF